MIDRKQPFNTLYVTNK